MDLRKQKPSRSILVRFLEKIELIPFHECWEWIGSFDPCGYGMMRIGSRTDKSRGSRGAHRLSYELFIGPITKGLYVLHKCDNPSCVRPDHLFLGTQKENVKDMWNKNRQGPRPGYPGEKNPQSKLSKEDIIKIRKDLRLHKEIAKDYNISRSVITRIKNKDLWSHVAE